jgi:hypothetical protein
MRHRLQQLVVGGLVLALVASLAGCLGHRLNPCAQYLLSDRSPVPRSTPFDASDMKQRPQWQPQPGEGFVGAANGKMRNQALLQFQKDPGGPSLKFMNPTRVVVYECTEAEIKDRTG